MGKGEKKKTLLEVGWFGFGISMSWKRGFSWAVPLQNQKP
jgi:hypothetical protein